MTDRSWAPPPTASEAVAPQPSQQWRAARNVAIGSVIFSAVFAVAFRYFAIYHKSLVWVPDGAAQHFPSMYFLNQIVRQFLHNPGQGFPFWSWQLGLGADTISTLSFYVVGDPFVPISLLFPMRSLELAYTVVYIVRIACAGVFSAMYLRKMGARPISALAGSLIYCLATFTLYSSTRHPIFATALALFPLLLLGAEYALERKRSWVLVVAVFLGAVGNFYFFYMEALTLVIYVIARYFETTPREDRWRRLAPDGLRIAGSVALGILLAGPVLLPSAAAIFTTVRRQIAFAPHLFFSLQDYGRYLAALVSTAIGPNSTVLGFAPLGFVVIPAVFMRRGNTALKVMLAAFPFLLGLPVVSAVYNGFTFPSGRYGFEWGLFIALAVGLLLADDNAFSGRELGAMLAAYVVMWACVFMSDVPINAVLTMPFAIGLLTWGVFVLEWLLARRGGTVRESRREARNPTPRSKQRDWNVPPTRWAVFALLVAGIVAAGGLTHDARYANSLRDNLAVGQVLNTYLKAPGALASGISDDTFYRVQDSEPLFYNDALVQHFRPTSYYFSLLNGNVTNFIVDNDIRGGWSSFSYSGFDDRAALDEITAVKYYTAAGKRSGYVPYGYDLVKKSSKGGLYENRYSLPLGFVYDHIISRAAFEALPIIARQQAMLEGAVIEDGSGISLPSVVPSVTVVDVPFSVVATKGADVDLAAGRIVKLAANSRIDLRFSAPVDAELYVQLAGFDDVASSPLERRDYLLGPNPTPAAVAALKAKNRLFWTPVQVKTWYTAGGPEKSELWQTPAYPYYWGNRTQTVNLGYQRSVVTTATMRLEVPGTLTFRSLKVLAVPMASYVSRVAPLRANPMREIRVGNNTVAGEVDSPRAGLLFLSIPFSSGWRATVDGKPARTVRANTAFTGIPVTAGKHAIELRYTTPGFALGSLVAGVALLLSAMLLALAATRRRRESRS